MSEILKKQGMNKETIELSKALLNEKCTVGKTVAFSESLQKSWEGYSTILEEGSTYICYSDVIETYFGKLKQKLKGSNSLTEIVLIMATWGKSNTEGDVEKAMENSTLAEIRTWKEANTTPSLLKRRKEFFAQNCTKKAG